MNAYTFIKGNLSLNDKELSSLLESTFKSETKITKMKYSEYESLINTLFTTDKSQSIRIINSYLTLLVGGNLVRIFKLSPTTNKITASSKDLIQNYKFIYMFNRFIDCSELLKTWSPTEAYFPVLVYINQSNPDKPIDYTYWIKRFKDLSTAFKFIKQNNVVLDFTDSKELSDIYKTIPQQYVQSFLDALGNKSWYTETIKETDHFLDTIEEWEDDEE